MEAISSENIPYFNKQYNFHSRYEKLHNLLRDPSPFQMMKNLSQVFSDDEIDKIFTGHNKRITDLA